MNATISNGLKAKRRRPKLAAPEPLESVLERAGENRFAKRQLPIPLAEWRAAVGPRIADRARPIALERDVLVVKVVTSVWANELSLLSSDVIAKLAERGFVVKQLRFRVGPLDIIEGVTQRKNYRKVPPPAPLTPELARALDRVEDEGLRDIIGSAARANLAWQRLNEAPPASRGPRGAGRESAPPGRTGEGSGAASRRTREDD